MSTQISELAAHFVRLRLSKIAGFQPVAPPNTVITPAWQGSNEIGNKYLDSMIAKEQAVAARHRAQSDWGERLIQRQANLIDDLAAKNESLGRNSLQRGTPFATGAALTAGGYGLGRLATLLTVILDLKKIKKLLTLDTRRQ